MTRGGVARRAAALAAYGGGGLSVLGGSLWGVLVAEAQLARRTIGNAEGTPPLVYASCFGHEDIAETLLKEGAKVDVQDKNLWTPLIWAMTNRHKGIVKLLLENGASPDHKSSGGRTAFDFVEPNSEISDYLHESGYSIGNAGVTDDFYSSGFSQDRFEQEMQENDMKRRMMMESAFNLEVDIGNLGLDEQPEVCGL